MFLCVSVCAYICMYVCVSIYILVSKFQIEEEQRKRSEDEEKQQPMEHQNGFIRFPKEVLAFPVVFIITNQEGKVPSKANSSDVEPPGFSAHMHLKQRLKGR